MKIFKYNIQENDFNETVRSWFDVPKLDKIHEVQKYDLFTREKDQCTRWHKMFYKRVREDSNWEKMYLQFLEQYIKPRYDGTIVYQRIPTFRTQMPGNLAVGDWHKDRAYRNLEWANATKEVNYYLPFTDTNEYNTIWTESEEDKGDYSPMLLKYGDIAEWDGSNLMHGNKINDSEHTRVSVDFRVMPLSRYKDSDKESINVKTPFKVGGYYKTL